MEKRRGAREAEEQQAMSKERGAILWAFTESGLGLAVGDSQGWWRRCRKLAAVAARGGGEKPAQRGGWGMREKLPEGAAGKKRCAGWPAGRVQQSGFVQVVEAAAGAGAGGRGGGGESRRRVGKGARWRLEKAPKQTVAVSHHHQAVYSHLCGASPVHPGCSCCCLCPQPVGTAYRQGR